MHTHTMKGRTMAYGKPQIRVNLGTVEITDTDRRAIAWYRAGRPLPGIQAGHVSWACATLADRADVRRFVQEHGENGLADVVVEYLAAGGTTATMEARAAER